MSIFKARYGKALIGVCFILMAIYLGAGWQSQKDWHTQYNYLHSDEFVYDYTNHPSYYVKSYDGEKEIPYESMDDYRQDVLTIGKTRDDTETYYYNDFNFSLSIFVLPLLFVFGFLTFFVDYRTNFTRFLLSLPFQRKEIFRKKIVFVLVPIIGALTVGIVGNFLLRIMMIDSHYFLIPLSKLLLSGISTLVTNLLVFATGLLCGILLGNLVAAPLSIIFILFLAAQGNYFYSSCRMLFSLLVSNGATDYYTPFNLWVAWPEGVSYPIWIYLLYGFFILLMLILSEKIFLRLSLDNEGDYVTVPAFRAPTYWLMSIGTWLYLLMISYFPHDLYNVHLYDDSNESYQGLIIRAILLLFVCIIISLLMVYPKELMNWWHKRRNKLA
ncbi:hypothetical protein [Candidatus Enterococcus testudinis]|nr:hypothetical protein [Enterococcus sp. 8G7_MSG3316]